MEKGNVKAYYVFSPATRIYHWVMVATIFTLFPTGLYIGNPGLLGSIGIEPTFAVGSWFSMSTIRFIHFTAAYILVAALLLRIYGFIIHPGDRLLPNFWKRQYWEGMLDTQLHYLFLRAKHRPYLRNSLARSGYASVYVMIVLEALTGFAMLFMVEPNGWGAALFGWVNHAFRDEYIVHLIHHYIAWFIMLFVIVHVYMVFRADVLEKGGEASGMISGVKYYHEEPDDVGDLQK